MKADAVAALDCAVSELNTGAEHGPFVSLEEAAPCVTVCYSVAAYPEALMGLSAVVFYRM